MAPPAPPKKKKDHQSPFDIPGHVGNIAELLHLPDCPWRFDAKLVNFIILQRCKNVGYPHTCNVYGDNDTLPQCLNLGLTVFSGQVGMESEAKWNLEQPPRSLGLHIQKSWHFLGENGSSIYQDRLHLLNPKLYVSRKERHQLGRQVKRSTKSESNTAKLHCMDLKSASQWLRAHLARLPPATAPPGHFEVSIANFRLGKQRKNACLFTTLHVLWFSHGFVGWAFPKPGPSINLAKHSNGTSSFRLKYRKIGLFKATPWFLPTLSRSCTMWVEIGHLKIWMLGKDM